MKNQPTVKGPWVLRVLIVVFSVVLGLLIFWLLGFVLDDIGDWPGPSYSEVEESVLDPQLRERRKTLDTEIAQIEREIADLRSRQELLRDSTAASQRTMNQLLEFARLSLERDVAPSPREQEALAQSQEQFLENQAQYQQINEQLVELNEQQRAVSARRRDVNAQINEQSELVREEYERLWMRHNMRIAAVELAVLAPLLVVASVLFMRLRGTLYAPLTYAFGIAVVLKVGLVMHEYFPARYFRYVLVGLAIALVLRVLLYLLRSVASPSRQSLLRQFREAYEVFLCPVCSFPIRRGPLKFQYWTARTLKKKNLPAVDSGGGADEPYTCPACSTHLYEECPACHAIRPSLLPSCPQCGAEKEVAPQAAEG